MRQSVSCVKVGSNRKQFHIEHQSGVAGDHTARALCAIAQLWRNHQGARAADLHALHAFVPTFDDLACAQAKAEGVAAVFAAVELGTFDAVGVEPAGVVHADMLACCGLRAGADGGVEVLQSRGCGDHGAAFGGLEKMKTLIMPLGHTACRAQWSVAAHHANKWNR